MMRRVRWVVLAGCAAMVGCAGEVRSTECPGGTIRSNDQCVPDRALATATPYDAGPVIDGGLPADAGVQSPDAGGGVVSLPFYVDEHYAMSGFFPGPPGVMEVTDGCVEPGTAPQSVCRRITFRPNGSTFGGFFFQAPADNWGSLPGREIEPGATTIRFRAWGELGGERVKFGAGLSSQAEFSDGWNVETDVVRLTQAPVEHTVDISSVVYREVVGAFLWVVEVPDGVTTMTIYLDNVRWE